jgi:Na+/phosphate symporter
VVLAVTALGDSKTYVSWFLGLTAVLGYPVALFFGVPIYLLARKNRIVNRLRFFIVGGAGLGAIDYLLYCAYSIASSDKLGLVLEQLAGEALVLLPLGMLAGAVAGLCFWCIAQPD